MQLLSFLTFSILYFSTLGAPAANDAIVNPAVRTVVACPPPTGPFQPEGPPSTSLACENILSICTADAYNDAGGPWADPFNQLACLAGLPCLASNTTIDQYIASQWWGPQSVPRKSVNEPRLSKSVFTDHSSDGKVWTQQNFIDAYYCRLSQVYGPYRTEGCSADVVKGYWAKVAAWTGFCKTKAIPYQNLADYYTYSSTVKGASATC